MKEQLIPIIHSKFSILILLALTVILVPGINFAGAQTNINSSNSSNHTITVSGDTANSNNLVSSNGTLSLSNNSIPLHKEDVVYYKETSGYLVYPENTSIQGGDNQTTSKLPGVVMIHEWWGLNDHIRNMADELAKEGYAVLAVDLYNGKVAAAPDEAMSLVTAASENQNESNSNMMAAVDYLKSLDNVDSSKIVSVGWCFGGGQALQLALNADPASPITATVLYYGNLVTDQQQLSKLKGPVLGIFGSEDQSIPVSEVRDFENELDAINIPNEIYIYEGVGHAFANPTGESFAHAELKDAWQKTVEFLNSNTQK